LEKPTKTSPFKIRNIRLFIAFRVFFKDWPRLLEKQMRVQSIAFIIAMSLGRRFTIRI